MNRILSTLTAILLVSSAFAQGSLKILDYNTGADISTNEITVTGDGAVFEVKNDFKAVWQGSSDEDVAIKRIEMQTIPNTADYFCWVVCYGPKAEGTEPIWYAADTLPMKVDDTVKNFSVYLNPNMEKGMAKYRYVFAAGSNPMDTTYLDVVFDIATVGIEDINKTEVAVYPNPASEVVNITLSDLNGGNVQYRFVDPLGKIFQEGQLNREVNVLDIKDFDNGVYILQLIQNDELIKSEKLIINN